jgi:hypothetical protein
MAVGTPALVGGQHVVIRLELSPHASAVLFVSVAYLLKVCLSRLIMGLRCMQLTSNVLPEHVGCARQRRRT